MKRQKLDLFAKTFFFKRKAIPSKSPNRTDAIEQWNIIGILSVTTSYESDCLARITFNIDAKILSKHIWVHN